MRVLWHEEVLDELFTVPEDQRYVVAVRRQEIWSLSENGPELVVSEKAVYWRLHAGGIFEDIHGTEDPLEVPHDVRFARLLVRARPTSREICYLNRISWML